MRFDFYKLAQSAKGIPDREEYGDFLRALRVGELYPWVVQRHEAERAGPHYDIRFGAPGLFSWAARKGLPTKPGQKVLAVQQPLHEGQYIDFEGEIIEGYGKGLVKKEDKGQVLITKVKPDQITFVVAHRKFPEVFTLIRDKKKPKNWLLVNITPTETIKHKKVHYTKVPTEDVEKLFDPDYLASAKIDGAAAFIRLLGPRIETLSYRTSKKGIPIIHTYRVGTYEGINIPKKFINTILRGEIYGVKLPPPPKKPIKFTEWKKIALKDPEKAQKSFWKLAPKQRSEALSFMKEVGLFPKYDPYHVLKAIRPQELGGILNASVAKSLQKQRAKKIALRLALFGIKKLPTGEIPKTYPEQLALIQEMMKYLPPEKFTLPPFAETPEAARKLWEAIRSKKFPLTEEGLVFFPKKGGKPRKAKLTGEADVIVEKVFPGTGRLKGKAAGGFWYSLPEAPGKIVGKVGTGFSDEMRRWLWEHRNDPELLGRLARIKFQEQFPSGAYRAPRLISLHEDYGPKQIREAKK